MKLLGLSCISSAGPFIVNNINIPYSLFWGRDSYSYKPTVGQYIHLQVLDTLCYIEVNHHSLALITTDKYIFLPHTEHWMIKSRPSEKKHSHLCLWTIAANEHEEMEFRLVYEYGLSIIT